MLRSLAWLSPTWIVLTLSGCGDSVKDERDGHGGGEAGRSGSSGTGGVAGTTGGATPLGGASGQSSVGGSGGAIGGGESGGGSSGGGAAGASGGTTGGVAGGGASSEGGASGGAEPGGAGGEPAAGGTGGQPTTEVSCSFEISGEISPEIATVGLVDWSTDLEGLTGAQIEFSLDDPARDELNIGSGGPISASAPRALLLGLKPDRSYTYRILAIAGDTFCVSEDQAIRTEPDPDAPELTQTLGESDLPRENGFIVTCQGTRSMIIDADGDVVWWTSMPTACSRAHMDWEGEFLWTVLANPGPSDVGRVSRVSMDGSGAEEVSGLERSHHDFAVLPGGVTAFLIWTYESDQASDLVERSPDGTLTTVATLGGDTLNAFASRYHANAIRYYERDDSYSVSDLNLTGVTKLSRSGELKWQARVGCSGPRARPCAQLDISGTHGHQVLENGNLLFFSASQGARGNGAPSPVYEYSFIEGSLGVIYPTLEWSYESEFSSDQFGDVQRLANGNTLVTYSYHDSVGTIHEVTPARAVVRSLTGGAFGYASFRERLYGPPQ